MQKIPQHIFDKVFVKHNNTEAKEDMERKNKRDSMKKNTNTKMVKATKEFDAAIAKSPRKSNNVDHNVLG
jgi:hypothetical protein